MWLYLVGVILCLLVVIALRTGKYYATYGKSDVEKFRLVQAQFRNSNGSDCRLFRTGIGPLKLLGTCHPEVIQQILTHPDCLERPFLYRFTGLQQGLISARYHQWKSQRKALNPTFNLRILNSFVPIMEACCKKMVNELHMAEDGATIDILQYTLTCTMEMVFGTTIGMDVLNKIEKEIISYIERLFNLVSKRMVNVHLYPNWIYRWTKDYREDCKLRKICTDKADEIINEKRQKPLTQNNNALHLSDETEPFKKPQIFIDQLLSDSLDGRKFSDEEIYHNAYTIILAGNETSALAVAHGCLLLAMHPAIQDKVYAEIIKIIPFEQQQITPEMLKQLEYTEMVIKEILRLATIVPNIVREAIKDVCIDGKRISKGTMILISLYELHRRRDIWGEQAKEFDPEQFDPEHAKERHPYAYLPFSGGSRNCIGWRYAMMSMKVMLVYLLRNFKLTTDMRRSDLRYKFDITLKLASHHLVRIERRNTM